MIGGTEGEGGEGKVGPGREGLMALASAGCEMPSSSYTAGPRPQLPGLWAAELASVASTQALQRAWQAGLRGRRQRKERLGTSQEQAGQVRKWLRFGRGARGHGRPSRPSAKYGRPKTQICGHLWWRQTGLLSRE